MKGNIRFLQVALCAIVVLVAGSCFQCEAANLLVNPGFESGAVSQSPGLSGLEANWNYSCGGGYFRPETVLGPVVDGGQTFIHSGAEAQDTCGDTQPGNINTQLAQRHPVTPGTWYVASAFVFAREMELGNGLGSGPNDYAGVRIRELDENSDLVVDRGVAAIYEVTTDFVLVSQTFRTEANTRYVDYILDTLVNNERGYWGCRIIYDDCVLEETAPPAVEPPVFSPDGGTYNTAQSVIITCPTAGAAIYYTTDGSDPTELSNLYTAPITVDYSLTLKAVAINSGVSSTVKSAAYTIVVDTPVFTPDGGIYSTAQNVTITCATVGASIHYTTDGSDPTESSLLYAVPIVVDRNTRLKAKAFYNGASSEVKSALYTVGYQEHVILACCNADGVVEKFSTDGVYLGTFLTGIDTPNGVVQGPDGSIYLGIATGVNKYKPDGTLIKANLVTTTTIVTALAWKDDQLWVNVVGSDYIGGTTGAYDPVTGEQTGPIIDWGAGSLPGGLAVGPDGRCYVSFWGLGAVIAWDPATDATEVIFYPEVALPHLSWSGDELFINSNGTSVSKWTAAGGVESWVDGGTSGGGILAYDAKLFRGSATYIGTYSLADKSFIGESSGPYRYLMQFCVMTSPQQVDSPEFSPGGGIYASAQTVTMTSPTDGATIHYTLDRTDPTEASPTYTSPITISGNTRLTARAYKLGVASAPTIADYVIGPQSNVILAAARVDGTIEKFSRELVYLGNFATGLNSPAAVAQGADGSVYVGTLTGVSKFKADGTLENASLIATDSQVTGLAWKDDKLWLTTYGGETGAVAAAYDPATGVQSGPKLEWYSPLGGLAFGPDGRGYIWSTGEVDAWGTTDNFTEMIAYLDVPPVAGAAWSDTDLFYSSRLYEGKTYTTIFRWNAFEGQVEWTNGRNFAGGMLVYEGKLYRAGGSYFDTQNILTAYSLADKSVVFEGEGPGRGIEQICVMTATAVPMPIAEAKGATDGTLVACESVVVTAVFGSTFYVENPDRTSGIQVRTTGAVPAGGDKVTVSGVVQTDTVTGERYIDATSVDALGTDTVLPVLLTNKNLGGGPEGLQEGIDGASGLNNVGLLIRATGKVETPGGGIFYLNDGSDVTVKVTGGTLYAQNSYVAVTGIMSCDKIGGTLSRVIRALSVTKLKDP